MWNSLKSAISWPATSANKDEKIVQEYQALDLQPDIDQQQPSDQDDLILVMRSSPSTSGMLDADQGRMPNASPGVSSSSDTEDEAMTDNNEMILGDNPQAEVPALASASAVQAPVPQSTSTATFVSDSNESFLPPFFARAMTRVHEDVSVTPWSASTPQDIASIAPLKPAPSSRSRNKLTSPVPLVVSSTSLPVNQGSVVKAKKQKIVRPKPTCPPQSTASMQLKTTSSSDQNRLTSSVPPTLTFSHQNGITLSVSPTLSSPTPLPVSEAVNQISLVATVEPTIVQSTPAAADLSAAPAQLGLMLSGENRMTSPVPTVVPAVPLPINQVVTQNPVVTTTQPTIAQSTPVAAPVVADQNTTPVQLSPVPSSNQDSVVASPVPPMILSTPPAVSQSTQSSIIPTVQSTPKPPVLTISEIRQARVKRRG